MKRLLYLPLIIAVFYLSSCKKDAYSPAIKQDGVTPKALAAVSATITPEAVSPLINGYLKVQLAKDSINTDEVIISFDPASKPCYVPNEDARSFQGFGAVNLSSLSKDNVPLSINSLPFPTNSSRIALVVNAKTSGIYKLNLADISSIPRIFQIWLMDNYKKDSLDFRNNHTYAFNLNVADTASRGSNRFTLVVRQNPALGVHLLSFIASKMVTGAQLAWKTENEENYTTFTIQRSTDGGGKFTSIASSISSAVANYTITDKTPVSGTDQYRLMMKDINGAVIYSPAQSLSY